MPQSRAEALGNDALDRALATNEGRIVLFRQLVSYEEADTYIEWCRRWGADPTSEDTALYWSALHDLYMLAWQRLGSDAFWAYMRLGANGIRLGGGT